MNEEELIELIAKLHASEPCPKHGRKPLRICVHCKEDVRCSECHIMICQCWNDE